MQSESSRFRTGVAGWAVASKAHSVPTVSKYQVLSLQREWAPPGVPEELLWEWARGPGSLGESHLASPGGLAVSLLQAGADV